MKDNFFEELNILLNKYSFRAVLGESGVGTIIGRLEGFDLIIEAETEEKAIEQLACDLIGYAQDYFRDFPMYYNSANRKPHFPYVLRVLLAGSQEKVMKLIE